MPIFMLAGDSIAVRARAGRGRLHSENLAALPELVLAMSVGEEPEVADAHEALGDDVQQEAAQELIGFEFHDLVFRAIAYQFWMAAMTPIRRVTGNQYMHHKSDRYRHQVRRKLRAYHNYVQLGCITQGLLQYLAITSTRTVWHLFRSWLRTMHTDQPPSELVVAHALRSSLPEFLAAAPIQPDLANFLRHHLFQAHDQARQRIVA